MLTCYRKKLGNLGEKLACQFLLNKHYQLIQKNFLIRGGQIDLIMLSPEQNVVFVEVKTRFQPNPEKAANQEIILSHNQIKALHCTAQTFLQNINFPFATWQFDLIWINFEQLEAKIPKAKIKHYQNILAV